MDFKRFLDELELHRIQFFVTLHDKDNMRNSEAKLIVDTGNVNTLVSQNLVEIFSIEKISDGLSVTIGGQKYKAERHILPCIELEPGTTIQNVVVESVDFDASYELYSTILLGLNTLNNWDYTISNKEKYFYAVERLSIFLPNKLYPYKSFCNSFAKCDNIIYI
ncbi:MAG: hypothetical protein LBI54_01785 [Lachnospiraceae bacterium]|nr:hypothetical protein [Lachnospiraceae bacterium]